MILETTKRKNILNKFNSFDFKIYFIVSMVFLVGIIMGAIYFRMVVNDLEIRNGIVEKFSIMENVEKLKETDIFMESFFKNIKIIILLWIIGVSAVGSPFLLLFCLYKGFSIAFTISTVLINLGFIDGNIFIFKSMFLYLLFSVFAIIVLTVSSLKVTLNVFKNKKDIRFEIVRHSILSTFGVFLLFISTILETLLIVKI